MMNLHNEDHSGLMQIGVVNKNARSSKIYGTTINYSLQKGTVKAKVVLDGEKRKLVVYTHSSPRGELSELPPNGLFVPAVQNKTQKHRNIQIRVKFEFGNTSKAK